MPRQPSRKAALTIGNTLARETLQRRLKAAKTRERALQRNKSAVTRTIATVGARGLALPATRAKSAGVLIAEGDSWFDYPLHDVLKDLEDLYGYDVESVAHRGDSVEDMAYGSGQLDDFSRRVEKVLRSGIKPRAILLSGGGNDIAGDEFPILLNHATSSVAGLNESIVTGVIDERLKDAYCTILQAVTAICRQQIGEVISIVIHGYDYPVPDGRGFMGGAWFLPGPWLEPGFLHKGYQDMVQRVAVMKDLIDRFNRMIRSVTATPEFAHVKYLDLRGILGAYPKYKDTWANELHPTRKGFEAITAKFASAI